MCSFGQRIVYGRLGLHLLGYDDPNRLLEPPGLHVHGRDVGNVYDGRLVRLRRHELVRLQLFDLSRLYHGIRRHLRNLGLPYVWRYDVEYGMRNARGMCLGFDESPLCGNANPLCEFDV